jgi:hypothetical protein
MAKKHVALDVIVAKQTPPETVTVTRECNNRHMTLLTAIAAFGDSVPPMSTNKNKTFETERLTEQQLFQSHERGMRSAKKMFITEVLFIDWLQTQFSPKCDQLYIKTHQDELVVLLVDEHASNRALRVLPSAASRQIILIRLVAHSSHISQPLDLSVFSILKILYKRDKKHRQKGETLKIYCDILVFCKAKIVPIMRGSFLQTGFRLNPRNFLAFLTVARIEISGKLSRPNSREKNLAFLLLMKVRGQ